MYCWSGKENLSIRNVFSKVVLYHHPQNMFSIVIPNHPMRDVNVYGQETNMVVHIYDAQDVSKMIIVIGLWIIGIFVAFHMLCGIVNIATGRDPGTGEKNVRR